MCDMRIMLPVVTRTAFFEKLQLKNMARAELETEASAQLRWEIVFGKK